MFTKKLFVIVSISALCLIAWQFAPAFLTPKTVVIAQTNNNSEEKKNTDVSPEIKEKAIKLLNNVARETQQFTVPENRVKGQIRAADLLWEHDEQEARKLFQNALSELQAVLNSLAVAAEGEEEPVDDYTERYTLSELRREYLLTLAPRDPKAALQALQALKLENPSTMDYDPLKEDELEAQIAASIAKKDPQKGYELAAKSIKEGVNYNTFQTLTDLYKQNAEMGAKFARDILAKFKSGKVRSYNANGNMAGNFNVSTTNTNTGTSGGTFYTDFSTLAQFVNTAAQLNRLNERSKDKKVPALTDGEMRELADFIGHAFSRQQNAEPWQIASAMPTITKYSPTAAQLIRRKLNAQQLQSLDMYGDGSNYYEERDTKTVEELIADAEKLTNPSERDSRYADAIRKALEDNQLEKASDIAGKIKDKKSYEYIFDEIKTQTPIIKARRGDITEVRKLLATISNDDEKVQTLTELVTALATKGDKETAGKLIDEANQFLPARLKRKPNLDTTLQIAGAYALVQPERSFNLIENSIAQMNDLIAAGTMIDDFYDYGTLKNDEILYDTMERQGYTHTTNFVALVKNLAKADFDGMVNLSDRFARPEIRTFVRLKIAEALLDPEAATREKTLREQYQNEEHDH